MQDPMIGAAWRIGLAFAIAFGIGYAILLAVCP